MPAVPFFGWRQPGDWSRPSLRTPPSTPPPPCPSTGGGRVVLLGRSEHRRLRRADGGIGGRGQAAPEPSPGALGPRPGHRTVGGSKVTELSDRLCALADDATRGVELLPPHLALHTRQRRRRRGRIGVMALSAAAVALVVTTLLPAR